MRVDVYIHTDDPPATDPRIDQVLNLLQSLTRGMTTMSATVGSLDTDITKLQNDIAAQNTVIQSAETLIGGISDQIKAAVAKAQAEGATPAQLSALEALDSSITGSTASLAAAVQANTPSPPASPPPATTEPPPADTPPAGTPAATPPTA